MATIRVELAERAYDLVIGAGARRTLPQLLARLAPNTVAIVADARVADLHLPALESLIERPCVVLRFPPGEASKSLRVAGELYERLADGGVARDDLVLTFGGGVAGDLGGFVAATWQRGVRFVQTPTSLEAAIDASVGGKTGVNHACGKNLIGSFHQPAGVIIDIDFLATLPQREYVAALAESVKHALIRDASFLNWHEANLEPILRREPSTLEELIARNCEIKARVVEQDEREAGLRMILNFGHTIGHACEHLLNYEWRHGECVALGILAANRIAVRRGVLPGETEQRVRELLAGLGLPTRLPRPLNP
ncbi:MAG: 3-dehydroquinate synthase, partial [Planctomycetota bacterium]